VRDSYKLNDQERLIFVSDRISAFDRVLKTPVPMKGAVLNKITNFWFENTRHIIPNHFLREIDPNITIVREVKPVRVEMVVRGYLSGSMWRYYQQGKRGFSGITLPDGMTKNQKFEKPILTPTTKEESDREITPEEIVSSGLATAEVYDKMQRAAIELYSYGVQKLAGAGIILVDTKYEFGLDGESVILIDEIHTPDASRFWRAKDYRQDPENAEQIDKEYVRLWLIANKSKDGAYPDALPDDIIEETTKRYLTIYNLVTGDELDHSLSLNIKKRVIDNLVKAGVCRPASVIFIDDGTNDPALVKEFSQPETENKLYQRYVKEIKSEDDLVAFLGTLQNSLETILPVLSEEASAKLIGLNADLKHFNGIIAKDKNFPQLHAEIERFLKN
jgi:phosphoribosylaminoimidazole-succinocarboxamide synthase